ncbi:hypothetical protein Tco_0915953 [Tanacetum coccineum]
MVYSSLGPIRIGAAVEAKGHASVGKGSVLQVNFVFSDHIGSIVSKRWARLWDCNNLYESAFPPLPDTQILALRLVTIVVTPPKMQFEWGYLSLIFKKLSEHRCKLRHVRRSTGEAQLRSGDFRKISMKLFNKPKRHATVHSLGLSEGWTSLRELELELEMSACREVRALTLSFNTATSENTPEVEALVLSLKQQWLCIGSDELWTYLLMILSYQSRCLMSKKLPPAAEFKECLDH